MFNVSTYKILISDIRRHTGADSKVVSTRTYKDLDIEIIKLIFQLINLLLKKKTIFLYIFYFQNF